jgi:hypothetical protein
MKSEYTKNQVEFIAELQNMFGSGGAYTRTQLLAVKDKLGYSVIPLWITSNSTYKSGVRGKYMIEDATLALPDITALEIHDGRGAPRRVLRTVPIQGTP